MSKLFINTIIQHGGDLSEKDKISVLNIISKQINKKMKIIEYKYGIQLKLLRLPENNSDCIRKKIGIQTVAQISGPLKGQIPFYTTTELSVPTPTISTVSTGVPLTPYGPIIGVPGLATNPFGNNLNKLEDRIKRANEIISILKEIENELKVSKCKDIPETNPLKKYFECIDLEEPDLSEENLIKKILDEN